MTSVKPMKVALVGEGTYPYGPGGVSLWCHQLVQGMPEHSFTAVALTVDGTETPTWNRPANLAEIVNIPLWGRRPKPPRLGRATSVGALPEEIRFAELHERFLHALFQPAPDNVGEFLATLREMFEYAQVASLPAALTTNDAVERMLRVWTELGMDAPGVGGALTLRDALTATDRIEHMLRPLSHPPIRVDVCHLAMNGLCALVGMTGKWAFGTPMVISEHGVYLRERYLGLTHDDAAYPLKLIMLRFFRTLVCGAYRMADVLTPHSGYNRRWQLCNGADPARIRTMYNGIDPADFPAATGEPDVPTIVFVGRIDPLKDLHTLLRAFAIVRKAMPDARLRIFGPVTEANEQYYASCLRLLEELDLTDAAAFEGRVPNQVDAYSAGHLVALTSVSEGFPFTVVESMSTGKPQVCTNVGGVSEAVGDAGFVVQPRDHEAVAEACIRLLEDGELRARLGGIARQRVMEWFTLAQWTDAYRDLYRELVVASRSVSRTAIGMSIAAAAPSIPPSPVQAGDAELVESSVST